VQSYEESQGPRIMWNYDVSLEPMFCLIDLLRLIMKLNYKVEKLSTSMTRVLVYEVFFKRKINEQGLV
jgi:hypothetical protein